MIIKDIFPIIKDVILYLGGTSVVLAALYAAFRKILTKWLDSKFDERLQDLKHKQNIEIKKMEFKISGIMDRAIKMNQKEFEILPIAWQMFIEAYGRTRELIWSYHEYPDLDRMNENELNDFLRKLEMSETEMREITNSERKNHRYIKWQQWKDYIAANNALIAANLYLLKNGILIDDDICNRMNEVLKLSNAALIEFRNGMQEYSMSKSTSERDEFFRSGENEIENLKAEIRKRIWPKNVLDEN